MNKDELIQILDNRLSRENERIKERIVRTVRTKSGIWTTLTKYGRIKNLVCLKKMTRNERRK